ncbi:MAG: hypothetical protein ACE5HE_02360 [Phycisphaerae bacterium]
MAPANNLTPPPLPEPSRMATVLLWITVALILLAGGYAFVDRLVGFVRTLALDKEDGGGFIMIPMMNYLMVTAGLVCLLVWGVAHDMLCDIERPKYTMLEREARLDTDDEREKYSRPRMSDAPDTSP